LRLWTADEAVIVRRHLGGSSGKSEFEIGGKTMDENKRGSFGSTIGFLLSAIGSAVGLGNIWGFPYKMGRCGGFTFLIVYLALAAFVGFAIMLSELAIGRSTGFGPVNAYKKVSKKFKWIGWLAIIAPFLIMTFYSVLGGYCIYYMVINVVGMFSGMPDSSSFAALLTNPWASIGCMVLFMLICSLINRGGVGGGPGPPRRRSARYRKPPTTA